jgi:predicted amidohydrolase YtcJ
MPFKKVTRIGALFVSLLSLVLNQCSSAPPDVLAPDLVLHDGKIVTVDEDFSIAEAVAIKDGRFVAVGSNSEILSLAGAHTETFDLEGKTVLPGLHDSHVHLAQRVADPPEPLIAKVSQARSIQEIVEVVRQKVQATPAGELVWLPRGPSVNRIAEKRWPTRHDLDPVSPDHPVILTFAGDYVNVANSAFLRAARIDRDVYQPYKHGLFGEFKVDRRGNLTGVVIGKGAHRILREGKYLNVWAVDQLEKNIAEALDRDIAPAGITTLSDPLTATNNGPTHRAYKRLAMRKEGLPTRINAMIRVPIRGLSAEDCIALMDTLLFDSTFRNDFLRVGTFKMSLDKGVPGGKPFVVPKETIREVLIEAHRQGWQLYLHITTPESFDYASEALEEAYRLYPREDARHVFTHINQPTQANLETMKRLGIIADLQTSSIYLIPDDARERWPANPSRPVLNPRPVATYRDAGIPVILSSDQAPLGPLFSVQEAVTRVRRSGKVFGPEERITLEEAIRAVTSTSAWAFFEEDVKGSIEAGKYADLVVLGRDILTIGPTEIKDIPILRTMTHGKFVYVNPNQDPQQEVRYVRYPARTPFIN